MDSEQPLVANSGISSQKDCGDSDRLSESSPPGGTVSQELACIEKLLMSDWKDHQAKPLTADELLTVGSKAFETLFLEPPIGPIPEYLTPHLSVYGCVAEYEDKLEELDRWKALELARWLKDRISKHWCIAGKVYQLQVEKGEAGASDKFWLRLVEDRTRSDKSTAGNS